MMKITWKILLFAALMPSLLHAAGMAGLWYTEGERSVIELAIEKDGTLTGRMISLKEPLDEAGQPKTDRHNTDAELQARPLIGLKLLWGFKKAGRGEWKGGRIYDPESGKTYYCRLTLDGDQLNVRGSLDKWGLAGRSTTWNRKKE